MQHMECQSCCLAQEMEHLPMIHLKVRHQAPSLILQTSLCQRHQPGKLLHPPAKPKVCVTSKAIPKVSKQHWSPGRLGMCLQTTITMNPGE